MRHVERRLPTFVGRTLSPAGKHAYLQAQPDLFVHESGDFKIVCFHSCLELSVFLFKIVLLEES